ncbi:MAG: DUF159 family protein [Candidatus Tectimicrobiota bacterium]|nr:MAG: DUF159 family protein [Candidatus Tectomicrobia bacterium]
MCGRFTLFTALETLQARFCFEAQGLAYRPSYNIAPGQPVLVVLAAQGQRRAGYLRWGLVPSWAKAPRAGLINARVETVAEKPSFREALRRRRCLVLADGFYEWRKTGATALPVYVRLRQGEPFAFAGLWDTWRPPAGPALATCTILTTAATALLQPLHPRMPVILTPDAEASWLDPRLSDPAALLSLLCPLAEAALEAYPVSRLVNSPHHNSPACIAPAGPPLWR